MLLLVVFGMRSGSLVYFEIALVLGALSFVSTLALAYVFLGEPLHWVQAIGTALVLVGATVVARA